MECERDWSNLKVNGMTSSKSPIIVWNNFGSVVKMSSLF